MTVKTAAARALQERRKNRTLPSIEVPEVQEASLARALQGIQEHLRMYEGDSGAPKERFVTMAELENAGLLKADVKGKFAYISQSLEKDVAQAAGSTANPTLTDPVKKDTSRTSKAPSGGSGGSTGATATKSKLNDNSDVNFANPAKNDFLYYDGNTFTTFPLFKKNNVWVAGQTFEKALRLRELAAGPSAVEGLGYIWVKDDQTLWWTDSAGNETQLGTGAAGATFAALTDTTVTSITSGEIPKWNGSVWVNNTLAEAGIAAASHTHVIADVTDFTDNSTNWDTAYGWGDHSLAGYVDGSAYLPLAGGAMSGNITGIPELQGSASYVVLGAEDSVSAMPYAGYNIDMASAAASHLLTGAIAGVLYQNSGAIKWYSDGSQTAGTVSTPAMQIDSSTLTVNRGISLGSVVAASTVDVSDHIALYSTSYGLNITGGSLNLVAAGSNSLQVQNGQVNTRGTHRIQNANNTDYVDLSHDGTDFNIAGTLTTDINVTGITAIKLQKQSAATQMRLDFANELGQTRYLFGLTSLTTDDFFIGLFNDAGTYVGTPLYMDGLTGDVTFGFDVAVTGDVTGANLSISNWDTAYGWGDHASGGYATLAGNNAFTGNPTFTISSIADFSITRDSVGAAGIKFADSGGTTGYVGSTTANPFVVYDSAAAVLAYVSSGGSIYADGNFFPSNDATNYVSATRVANWQTAYGWGDHASAGYAVTNSAIGFGTLVGGVSNSVATVIDLLFVDNANIGATQNLNFFIDTDGNQTGLEFGWYHNANGTSGATKIMTLQEDGDLVGTGAISGFTNLNVSNWDTAYGWGDYHSGGVITAGYQIKSTNSHIRLFGTANADPLDNTYIDRNAGTVVRLLNYDDSAATFTTLMSISEAFALTFPGITSLVLPVEFTTPGGGSANWNTAYGWGDHALAGYATGGTADTSYYKTASESVTSSITLQNDDHLASMTLTAGKYYAVSGCVLVQSGPGGFKWNFSFTQTPQFYDVAFVGIYDSSGPGAEIGDKVSDGSADGAVSTVTSAVYAMQVTGVIKAHATLSGTCTLQWAQNVSNAVAAQLKDGSCLTFTQLN